MSLCFLVNSKTIKRNERKTMHVVVVVIVVFPINWALRFNKNHNSIRTSGYCLSIKRALTHMRHIERQSLNAVYWYSMYFCMCVYVCDA